MQLELETNKDAFIYCLLLIVIGVASVLIWFRPWTSTVRLDIFHFMRWFNNGLWLRRWTWNPMGTSRTGLNPARSVSGFWMPISFIVYWNWTCCMPKLHQIWPGVFIYTPAKNEVNQIRDSQDMPRTSSQTHRWILCFTVKYISVYKYLSKRQYLKSWESFVYPFLAVRVIAQTLSVCCIKDQVVLTHMQQNKKKREWKAQSPHCSSQKRWSVFE